MNTPAEHASIGTPADHEKRTAERHAKLTQVKDLEILEKNTSSTIGEKIFDAISWGFFGWFVNAAASVKFADVLTTRYRPFFQRQSHEMAKLLPFRAVFGETTENGVKIANEEGQKMARSMFGVLALMPGGFIILAPVKWLEDRKLQIVRFIDRQFGPSNPDAETEAKMEARHALIAQAPVPSLWDMFKGRMLPLVSVITMHFSLASDKTNLVNGIAGKPIFRGWNHYIRQISGAIENHVPGIEWLKKRYIPQAQTQIEGFAKGGEGYYTTSTLQRAYRDDVTKIDGARRFTNHVENVFIDFSYSAVVAIATKALSHMFAWDRAERKVSEGKTYARALEQTDAGSAAKREAPTNTAAPKMRVDRAHYDQRLVDSAHLMQPGA